MSDTLNLPSSVLDPYRGAVLSIGRQHPLVEEVLEEHLQPLHYPTNRHERADFLAEHGATIKVAVATAGHGVDSTMLDRLPNLEAVMNFGVGYDAHDVEGLREREIPLSNTPDVLNECVADTALGLYLDTMRRFSAADRFVRSGKWQDGAFPFGSRAHHRTVGILGLGRIGFDIARRFDALSSEIHYWSRSEKDTPGYTYHSTPRELAEAVDILVVAIVGGPDTAGLVDAEVLQALGANGVVINIARGSVIDDDALVAALQDRTIAAAGLDVFVNEPNVDPRYVELSNTVLYPHVGSATHETREDMATLTLENVRSWLTDRTLVTPV
ncbi:MAG: 2-hydroxyacid dehydrogenase [Micrococcaceae bacterium]